MKRKHRVYYDISSLDHYWWQRGKWIHSDVIDWSKGASSDTYAYTFQKALKTACKCKGKMKIEKHFVKHGQRWMRELILHEEATQ